MSANETNGLSATSDRQVLIDAFQQRVGKALELDPVLDLNTDFVDAGEGYLLVNIKEYGSHKPDNVMLLRRGDAIVYSADLPDLNEAKDFEKILQKPYGASTVLVYITLHKVIRHHAVLLDKLLSRMGTLEEHFDHTEYRDLSIEFERLEDRLDELHELMLRFQERRYIEIETHYIAFDYRVLIAECQSLEARCRRRLSYLKDIRQNHEIRATEDLNARIIGLNEDVKRLTAITVLLMLPNLIAGHFGMNFAYMPELKIPWAYPAVIIFQLVLIGAGLVIFRRMRWL